MYSIQALALAALHVLNGFVLMLCSSWQLEMRAIIWIMEILDILQVSVLKLLNKWQSNSESNINEVKLIKQSLSNNTHIQIK